MNKKKNILASAFIISTYFIVDPYITYMLGKMKNPNHSMPEIGLYSLPMYFNGYDVGIYHIIALFMDYFDTVFLAVMTCCNELLFVLFMVHLCSKFAILGLNNFLLFIKLNMYTGVVNYNLNYPFIN